MLEGHLGRLAGIFEIRLLRIGRFLGGRPGTFLRSGLAPPAIDLAAIRLVPLGLLFAGFVAGAFRVAGLVRFFAGFAAGLFAFAGTGFAAGLGFFAGLSLGAAGLFITAGEITCFAPLALLVGTTFSVIADAVAAGVFVPFQIRGLAVSRFAPSSFITRFAAG